MAEPGQGRARGRGGRGRRPQPQVAPSPGQASHQAPQPQQAPPPGQAPRQASQPQHAPPPGQAPHQASQTQQAPPPGQAPQQAPQPQQDQPPQGAAVAAPPHGAPVGRGRFRQGGGEPGPGYRGDGHPQEGGYGPPQGGGRGYQRDAGREFQPGGGREFHQGRGRDSQRSGGRERQPRGTGPPVKQMGAMSLRERKPFVHQEPWQRYEDPKWKQPGKDTRGKTGDRAQVITNYFRVNLESEARQYHYAVEFKPEVENMRVKFAVISSLSAVTGPVKCFDGGALYLRRRLQDDVTECDAMRHYDQTHIKVKFTFKCEVMTTNPQFLQIANLLLRRVQETGLEMKLVRDHYFNMGQSVRVPEHRLEVVPGFTASILKYEDGNLLVVDIVHKVLRTDTFLDCLYNLYTEMQNQGSVNNFHTAAVKQFVGTIVMTKHNNKTYRVDDINWEGRPTSTFKKGDDEVSYVEYYKEHWNLDIVDMDQPLLVTRPTEKDFRRGQKTNLYLLPELCTITGLSEKARANTKLMKDLAVHTRVVPEKRVKTVTNFVTEINNSEKSREVLEPWQMSIEGQPVRVPARLLPAEQLLMKKKGRNEAAKISYQIQKADWSQEMRNCHLLNAAHINNWLMIYPNMHSAQALDLRERLIQVGLDMGLRIVPPALAPITTDRNDAYLQAIRQNLNKNVQMVVTVVPNNKKDRYDAIKKSCCIDNPVPSQVVVVKTLKRQQGLMSIAAKIAIQMNCKMGGEVWGAEIPLKGLMVVGMDSYHDSANRGESVGAVVASLNKECTRYYSRTELHPTKDELMRNLTVLLSGALKKYHEVNGAAPQKIVLYRDGVGDGQLKFVFASEVQQVKAACRQAGGESYNPGIAFVVVKKRISTRLGAIRGNSVMNPQPGTVVDEVITKPDWYDFFLVSQSVSQGTVTPTSYNVIFDESGLQPDHMQRLTYKLTHLYFNWQGTIRVPAPCQYAHKLAFLQGQSLHREFHASLADKLFYL